MKVGANVGEDLEKIIERSTRFESLGLDTITTAELGHDPFLPLMLAAEHTSRVELMTSIAVAFARNPMNLANLGHDLNAFSKGRFILGLGSQIRAHINWRYSMPWSSPAALREAQATRSPTSSPRRSHSPAASSTTSRAPRHEAVLNGRIACSIRITIWS